jgi:hypothetical protein
MLSSINVRWALIGLAVAVGLGLVLWPSDEKRVREAAEAIVNAANRDEVELAKALDEYAVEDVSISLSDWPEPLEGRAAIVRAAATARAGGRKVRFRMEAVEIALEADHARVNAELVASFSLGLRELKQARHGAAMFQKLDGRFRLVSAEVGNERHDQPEARP